jgi:hypothetical protein
VTVNIPDHGMLAGDLVMSQGRLLVIQVTLSGLVGQLQKRRASSEESPSSLSEILRCLGGIAEGPGWDRSE